ncbi:MAG: C40 family peptidase [Lewinella sp.]|nr:C40 family peptidase [Lewinella sp.]
MIIGLLSMLLSGGCQPAESPVPTAVERAIVEVQTHFAPDKRVARFQVEPRMAAEVLVIRGETSEPAARDSLVKRLAALDLAWRDSIVVWPDPVLGDSTYALVRQSVANLRTEPRHGAELTTQALMGTPLRVFKQEGDWYLVQTPDGYIAWLDSGGLARRDSLGMSNWRQASRLLYRGEFAEVLPAPSPASGPPLCDLTPGAILEVLDAMAGPPPVYRAVRLPDGRKGYLFAPNTVDLNPWLQRSSTDTAAIFRTAARFTGRPYLWGGTSPKGMDCSGFTKTVYFLNGFIIPRDASQQVHAGEDVALDENLSDVQPGDFLFFGNYREDGSERITHVGLYLGEGRFIHSGADNGAVRTQSLLPGTADYAPHRRESLLRARRLQLGSAGVVRIAEHPWYGYGRELF